MNHHPRTTGALSASRLAGLLVFAGVLASAQTAGAVLGRSASSIEGDRAHFLARTAVTPRAGFTVHELTAPNGTVVREYVSASDVVFAVSWRGAGRPDLQQLLGPSFEVLQADNVRSGARTRAPLRVQRTDLRVSTGGRPGAFWGRAVLPGAAPADFTAADFQ